MYGANVSRERIRRMTVTGSWISMGNYSQLLGEDEKNLSPRSTNNSNSLFNYKKMGTAKTDYNDFIDILFEPVNKNWSTFITQQNAEYNVYLNIPGLYRD